MQLSTVFALLSSIAATCASKPTTVVDLGYAKYEGSLNEETRNIEFLGMRYAAAPTGEFTHSSRTRPFTKCVPKGAHRWREPQLPRATPGIQKANVFPNRCWEAGQGNQPVAPFPLSSSSRQEKRAVPEFSEDCLFLKYVLD